MKATAAATAVVVTVLAGATLLVVRTLDDRSTAAGASAPAPVVTGPPPGELRLRDDGATITVTWTDPSQGTVSFVVNAGRRGQPPAAMATVDPGQTSYTVNGLDARVDYCLTVQAVWSTDTYAESAQACTDRRPAPPTGG